MYFKKWLALGTLVVLSPLIGELLTGNTPPSVFFTLPLFILTVLLYGLGAVLIRETTLRWHKGVGTIFILGLAYAAVEEALITKGFFNPEFYAVIAFGMEGIGRAGGINVLWALSISVFHALFAITIPIVLVNLLFGKSPWLGARLYSILLAVFAINGFAFYQFLVAHGNSYTPDPLSWLFVIVEIVALVLIAHHTPTPSPTKSAPHAFILFVAGFLISLSYFLQNAYRFGGNAVIHFVVLAGLVLSSGWWLSRYTATSRGIIALVSGLMLPMIVFGPLSNPYLIAAPLIALLVFVWFKAKNG